MEVDEVVEKLPNLEIAHWKFQYTLSNEISPNKEELKKNILDAVQSQNMAPFYTVLSEELHWSIDQSLLQKMKTENETKLKQLDDNIKDAVENLGESEVRETNLAKADFFARIGDKDKAVAQYLVTLEKTVGSGQKLDIVFTLIRIGLFWKDHDLIVKNLEKAKAMVDAGSDWDRRNRLKVYEALYNMSIRSFKKSATLFLETISTFSAVELIEYKTFIYYTIIMSIVSLDRVTLKKKVIDSPEVLAVVDSLPFVGSLMTSLYQCNYSPFFPALAGLSDKLKADFFMSPHVGYFCKEMRIIAYSQLLESYKSLQLERVASSFGVSVDFIDNELSRFIASGRLSCKIDKVGGVVETNRSDSKNVQYQNTIKNGDLLLNRIQKLSRVINL